MPALTVVLIPLSGCPSLVLVWLADLMRLSREQGSGLPFSLVRKRVFSGPESALGPTVDALGSPSPSPLWAFGFFTLSSAAAPQASSHLGFPLCL